MPWRSPGKQIRGHRSPLEQVLPSRVNGFGPKDSADLQSLLADSPVDFIDYLGFYKSRAEETIFKETLEMDHLASAWHAIYAREGGDNIDRSLLFTPAQEKIAFLQYNYSRFCVNKLQLLAGDRRLSNTEQHRLLQWHHRAKKLRDIIICANLGLCIARAHKVKQTVVDVEDLVSMCNDTLIMAINKFDVSRGFRFSTYAVRAIINRVSREVGKELKRKSKEVVSCEALVAMSSIELSYKDSVDSDEALSLQHLREVLSTNMAGLSELEQQVIRERFPEEGSWNAGRSKKLSRVAEGRLSAERIRQVQKVAIDKLRVAMGVKCETESVMVET
jgi:RNA polymerase primary sigma factor